MFYGQIMTIWHKKHNIFNPYSCESGGQDEKLLPRLLQ